MSLPSSATRRPIRLVLLIAVLLFAAAIRLLGIGNTDLWGDEAFSVTTAIGPIHSLIDSLATGEPHPPLYPLLLAAWLRLLGHSEVVARLPSAFAGIASVAVAAAIGARLGGDSEDPGADVGAVVAALLVALNPFQVWYSQEARMYAQVSFFAGLSTLALLRLDRSKRSTIVPYALTVAAVAGTHYFGLFVPLAHGVAVALSAHRRPTLGRRWLVGATIAGLIYLPWLFFARRIVLGYYGAQPGAIDLRQIALQSWVRIAAGWSLEWRVAVASAGVLTLFAVLGALLPARNPDDRFARTVLVAWLVVPYAAGYLVSLFRPMYAERYLIVASLPLTLLIARLIGRALLAGASTAGVKGGAPIGRQRRPWLPSVLSIGSGPVVLVAVLGLALGPLHNVWVGQYQKSTYNTHVGDVRDLFRPGDAVILDGTSQLPLYNYYLRQPWPTYPLPRVLPLDPPKTEAELADIARTHTGAWIFLYATPDYDPGYVIPRWLAQHGFRAYDNWQVTGRLQYYRFASPDSLAATPTDVKLGGVVKLEQIATTTADLAAGDSVPILFRFRRTSPEKKSLRVSLRLIDRSGETWAQADKDVGGDFFQESDWPDGQSLDDRHAIMIQPGTPPGDYRLIANIYESGSPNPLPPSGAGVTVGAGGMLVRTVHVSQASDHLWTRGIGGFRTVGASTGSGVELIGFAGSTEFTTGSAAPLSLYWKALADRPPATVVQSLITTDNGSVASRSELPLAPRGFPINAWHAGDVVRDMIRIPVPSTLAPGTYGLRVETTDASGNTASVDNPILLGTVKVNAGPPAAQPSSPQHSTAYSLGDSILLEGFDLASARVAPGGHISLKLHWSDVSTVPDDYTVFVHVLDAKEKVVAQRDQQPANGNRPTTAWTPGDRTLDEYDLTIPVGTAVGSYSIEVGMYNPTDGTRLPIIRDGQPAGDRIILTSLVVAS